MHIIVIGSGFGGLAAAIRLAAQGHAVEVFERRDRPGGKAYVYQTQGFTFDSGPTVITAPFMLEDLWQLAGRRLADDVELRPCDPFYRIYDHRGRSFDYYGDEARLLAEIERWSPADVAGYRRFIDSTRPIFEKGFVELADKPFLRVGDMARVAPDLLRLGAHTSVYSYVSRFISDEFLRRCFSFHPLFIGGSPFAASSIYAMIHYLERQWGVHYAVGGTGAIVAAMVRLLESLGGKLHLSAPVTEILVERGRAAGVRLASGEVLPADAVVSNADVVHTYRDLVRSPIGALRTAAMRHSMSLFVVYFGTDRRYEGAELARHTIMFGERYKALIADIFGGRLADDFSLYLHWPTRDDRSLAPDGCETFYVLSPVPHLGAPIDWDEVGPRYRDVILGFLEERYLPGLRRHIAVQHTVDPRHFRDREGCHLGAAFSLEPTLLQSAWFRPHNRSAELDNLYLVGAGTHPGAGLPGVLSSAAIAGDLIG